MARGFDTVLLIRREPRNLRVQVVVVVVGNVVNVMATRPTVGPGRASAVNVNSMSRSRCHLVSTRPLGDDVGVNDLVGRGRGGSPAGMATDLGIWSVRVPLLVMRCRVPLGGPLEMPEATWRFR